MLKLSRSDNIMARYGGDEFAILLVETPKSAASCYAERLRQALADAPSATPDRSPPVSGLLACQRTVLPPPRPLIRAADEALYAAKRTARIVLPATSLNRPLHKPNRTNLTPTPR